MPPAVLYLVHRFPYPTDKGDRIRAFHILQFLSSRASVHLACLSDEPFAEASLDALRRLCARVEAVPVGRWGRRFGALAALARGRTATEGAFRSPGLGRTLRRWAADTRFHAALASASSMVPYLRRPELRGVPVVVDLVDVDSQKWLDYAAASRGPSAWLYRTEGRRLRRLEQGLPSWARAVTLVSEAEADLCRRFCPDGEVAAVANGVDLAYFRPEPRAEEPACVFVGALDYRPNVDGVCWFAQEVWPALHGRHPECKLYLVGRQPTAAVRSLRGRPGVELVGTVPDVRPYLARAAVAVVPLHIARGVQNKVLEALAMGKAVVASPQALQGVRARPGTHLLSAASVPEWGEAVTRLLADAGLRRRLGAAGREFVEAHHSWERCLEPLAALLGLEERLAS
jgi:sugar transferase (PEP-CTERM/EpsH1 system associated)